MINRWMFWVQQKCYDCVHYDLSLEFGVVVACEANLYLQSLKVLYPIPTSICIGWSKVINKEFLFNIMESATNK
jgi:hypothetical protein